MAHTTRPATVIVVSPGEAGTTSLVKVFVGAVPYSCNRPRTVNFISPARSKSLGTSQASNGAKRKMKFGITGSEEDPAITLPPASTVRECKVRVMSVVMRITNVPRTVSDRRVANGAAVIDNV